MLENKTANNVIKRYHRILMGDQNQIKAEGSNIVDRYHRFVSGNNNQLEESGEIDYLLFRSNGSFAMTNYWHYTSGELYYKKKLSDNWEIWEKNSEITSGKSGEFYTIYLKGNADQLTRFGGSTLYIDGLELVDCIGKITNLIDDPDTAVYSGAFYDCDLLRTAPELPSLTLSSNCYNSMFARCENLIVAPELPALELSNACYSSMFNGCSSLKIAPELPATILANSCYYRMFGSSGIIDAPQLLAETLAQSCYEEMFNACDNLKTLPILKATSLPNYCYASMFQNCDKIKISETQTEEYINEYRIPYNGSATIGTNPLLNMFNLSGGTFAGTPTIETIYYTANDIIV